MATKALDVATILFGLKKMEDELFSGLSGWNHHNEIQAWLLPMLDNETKREQLGKINDMTGIVVLEGLMITVISVLDKTVRWKQGIAEPANIRKNNVDFPAFELRQGCRVYKVEGFGNDPLLVVETKSGDLLYIMMGPEEQKAIDLVKKAFKILDASKTLHDEYVWNPKAIIPKIYFELYPEIDFMLWASKKSPDMTPWTIAKATQEFTFRMNEEGARARVRTEMMLMGCSISEIVKKETIIIDKAFVGFFVQPGVEIPLAVFYADYDSWKDEKKELDSPGVIYWPDC